MSIITDVYAREVLDSRGNPTLEVEVYTLNLVHSVVVWFLQELQLVNTKQ